MEAKDWVELIAAILAGMATAIPLVYKLVQYVQQNIYERNWSKLIAVILDLMEDAEGMFDEGAIRKEWVMEGVMSLAAFVEYDINEEELSSLIDRLCEMSKRVNGVAEVK